MDMDDMAVWIKAIEGVEEINVWRCGENGCMKV